MLQFPVDPAEMLPGSLPGHTTAPSGRGRKGGHRGCRWLADCLKGIVAHIGIHRSIDRRIGSVVD